MLCNPEFNLVDEPWIPVFQDNGKFSLVGLRELFRNANFIVDLSVRPEERVSLMRLFLALAYASDKSGEWETHIAHLEEDLLDYLQEWHESFWLHHPECPFLQISSLKSASQMAGEKDLVSISKLFFHLASGNNPQLIDHGGIEVQDAQIARALLSYQCFSPGGLTSIVRWAGKATPKTSTDAPCIPQGMLHAFLRGRVFGESIRLNLVAPQYLQSVYEKELGPCVVGRPVWECFPKSSEDEDAIQNATRTIVGRLVPLARAILIKDNGMLCGEALRYPGFSNPKNPFPAELSATLVVKTNKDKQEEKLLSFVPERMVWREIPAFLVGTHAVIGRGPLTLRSLAHTSQSFEYDIVVDGVARSQASIREISEFVFPLRPKLLSEIGLSDYKTGLAIADSWERSLGWALDEFRNSIDTGWANKLSDAGSGRRDLLKKLRASAFLSFWTDAERHVSVLFAAANAETDGQSKKELDNWRQIIRSAAFRAYETVGGNLSGRQMQAFTLGRQKLLFHKE